MEPVPQGICGVKGGAGSVSGGEYCGMPVLSDQFGWGGALAPADHICGSVEVPPTGLSLFAIRHPRHRDGLSNDRG